ncbi:MAG TPA: enolase C-terminal domain-like protein [Thermodesulfobacteriota bacterium]
MRITAVEVYRKDLPLVSPFQHFASGHVRALEEVYVRLVTDAGVVGVGEARGNSHYLTGDSPDAVTAQILRHLAPALLGRDPRDLSACLDALGRTIVGVHGAMSAVDVALHDLVARAYGVPVYVLLGGAVRDDLPSNWSLWYGPPDEAARQAAWAVAAGFRSLKVRVGLEPFERDVERVRAVREAVGSEVGLAVDANMAWSARQAVRRIERLAPFGLDYVEQPVAYDDLDGLRYVTRHSDVPVMADESVRSVADVLEIARRRAADLVHLKLGKLGGIAGLRRAAAVAEAAGVGVMVGQTNEGALATAAAAHCAKAIPAAHLELYGAEGLATDPATGFALRSGAAVLREAPGLGVDLDLAALAPVGVVRADA